MWFTNLWERTKSIATMYTGTFIVVMLLNQLLFFGFCMNPVCLIAAMPHVLAITVFVGSWINKENNWGGSLDNPSKEFPDRFKTKLLTSEDELKAIRQAYALRNREISDVPEAVIEVQPKPIKIGESFAKFGVNSLWHLTHRDNVESIIKNGILSHSHAHTYLPRKPEDISDHGVQSRRTKLDPCYNRAIHDYAPLYIKCRNPMLFSRKHINHELCLIEISFNALDGNEFLITDGNAASQDTNFYTTASAVRNLPWEVLNAEFWNEFYDGKRKKCAEVLIFPQIEPEHIKAIHCQSDDCEFFLFALMGQTKFTIRTSKDLFF